MSWNAGLSAGLLILASLAVLAWWRARTGEFCSPFAVVVASWGLTFSLFLLRLVPFKSISTRAGAIILVGVGSLLAGLFLAPWLDRHPKPRVWSAKGASWWVSLYSLLGIAGTGWYLREVQQRFGLGAILHDAPRVRYALLSYEIPSRFLFLQFLCMAAPLLAAAVAMAGQRLRWWVWGLVLIAWAGTCVTTDRTQFFVVTLAVAFIWLYHSGPNLSLRRIATFTGLAAVVLIANFMVVGYWVGKSADAVGTAPWVGRPTGQSVGVWQRVERQALGYASTIYLYATGSYPAFAAYVEEEHPRTYGVQSLYPVARLLERVGIVRGGVPYAIPDPVTIVQTADRTVGFNAFTYLYYPYQDFGTAGVAGYSLLIGLLAGSLHLRTRLVRSSPLHLLVLGQVSMALTLSVFVNKFNNTATWYVLTVTVLPFLATVSLDCMLDRVRTNRPARG